MVEGVMLGIIVFGSVWALAMARSTAARERAAIGPSAQLGPVVESRPPPPRDVAVPAALPGVYTGEELERQMRFAGESHGVPWQLLAAIARTESNFDPRARGAAGEIGMMQFMPQTAKVLVGRNGWDLTDDEIRDPGVSLQLAAQLLAELADHLGLKAGDGLPIAERWKLQIHAYNLGEPKVRRGVRNAEYFRRVEEWLRRPEEDLVPVRRVVV